MCPINDSNNNGNSQLRNSDNRNSIVSSSSVIVDKMENNSNNTSKMIKAKLKQKTNLRNKLKWGQSKNNNNNKTNTNCDGDSNNNNVIGRKTIRGMAFRLSIIIAFQFSTIHYNTQIVLSEISLFLDVETFDRLFSFILLKIQQKTTSLTASKTSVTANMDTAATGSGLMEEYELMKQAKYRLYMTNIDKALKNFEYSSEWADLISALGKLNKVKLI